MKHVQETPVPPRQIVPSIPAELEAVVQRAMAKDPARRYHSADEMGMDLDRVRKGLGVTQATASMAATEYAAAGRTWSRRRLLRRPGRTRCRRRRRRRGARGRGSSC